MILIRKLFVLAAAICFGGTLHLFAQSRSIPEVDFQLMLKQAHEKAEGRSYREIGTYESFLSAKPELAEESVYEKQQLGREHYRSSFNGRVIDEWVRIGNTYYNKNSTGSWDVTRIENGKNKIKVTTSLGCVEMKFDSVTYEFVGPATIHGESVGEYKVIKVQHEKTNDGEDVILSDRFWVNAEGLILKSISDYGTGQSLWTRRTFNTDFSSVVDIRVPKIK